MRNVLIAIVGPTAIGKTSWAIQLAKEFRTEIISTDSRQFYKEMKIGTAVPSKDELAAVKHYFIQHRSVLEPWSVGDFERAATDLLDSLFINKSVIVAVGGSGLYIKALTEGLDKFPDVEPGLRERLNESYNALGLEFLQKELKKVDPEYFAMVDLQNPHRIIRALEVFHSSGVPFSKYLNHPKPPRPYHTLYIGIKADRSLIYERIEKRVDRMIENGLVDEAKKLIEFKELSPMQTVGYQELFKYFEGKWDLTKAVEEIKKNSRRYAKRQMTWFKKIQDIIWIDHDEDFQTVVEQIKSEIEFSSNEIR